MVLATYKKKGISITNAWFMDASDDLSTIKTDILYIHEAPFDKIEFSPAIIWPQLTLVHDLTASENSILGTLNSTTKRKVKQAEKAGITTALYTSRDLAADSGLLHEFGAHHDRMYRQKGMKAIFNHALVQAYMEADMLSMTTAVFEGHKLAYHAYVGSEHRARLLYSVSLFRDEDEDASLVARANTYLHYQDMMCFKNRGVTSYDWGGIKSFDEPTGIDSFKMGFGGERRTCFNIIAGRSMLGKALTGLLRMRRIISG
ncbi:MAG: aminoacyltransferase [Syntrophomonadaceae bacterium]|nr:aminoacyltransferase [Syntrophomonadaceae bacterium]